MAGGVARSIRILNVSTQSDWKLEVGSWKDGARRQRTDRSRSAGSLGETPSASIFCPARPRASPMPQVQPRLLPPRTVIFFAPQAPLENPTVDIRNIVIIAQCRPRQTTLVDVLLCQSGVPRQPELPTCVMDSNDQKRARDHHPRQEHVGPEGHQDQHHRHARHADFGGEVERLDGRRRPPPRRRLRRPHAQTRFSSAGHAEPPAAHRRREQDRPAGSPAHGSPTRSTTSSSTSKPTTSSSSSRDLLKRARATPAASPATPAWTWSAVRGHRQVHPRPHGDPAPLQMQCANIDHNDYVGRIAIGRVENGGIKVGQQVASKRLGGKNRGPRRAAFVFENLKRTPAESAGGEIVAVAGLPIDIGDDRRHGKSPALPHPDRRAHARWSSASTRALFPEDRQFFTVRHLRDRLYRELKSNVALKVEDTDDPRQFKVGGCGLSTSRSSSRTCGAKDSRWRSANRKSSIARSTADSRTAGDGGRAEPTGKVMSSSASVAAS